MTLRFSALSLLVLALLCGITVDAEPAPLQTKQETQSPMVRAIGRRLENKGVTNFGEVTPHLYRGGLLKKDGLKALKKLDINVVVDTHAYSKKEEREAQALGMKYVAIPWHCPWPKDEVFAKFLKVLHENPGKKVFVHCRLGDDRTGMMVAAYRMAEEGWTADEAMTEMKSFGFTKSHHFICPSLAHYEKEFPERFRNDPAFAEVRSKR
ncbi:MAG TPA: dual specificity protein phosphatase family protein [Candidatus Elarobacter sp.]|nr:dual specificity protein phosphatase family protein [Candidatus Elarobacter sp.]